MSARDYLPVSALTITLLTLPAMSAAGQWQAVASSAGSTVEIDKSRISRLPGGRTAAWTRLTLDHPVLDFENQMRYSVVQALNHYDCAKGSFATQQRVYLLENREMRSEKVGEKQQMSARPGSLDARLLEEACKPRTAAEMKQAAAQDAKRAAKQTAKQTTEADKPANEAPPRAMHAEMVGVADSTAPRSVQVADKPRLFEIPIDKSKAEDPYKSANATPGASGASAMAPPKPAPAPAPKPAYSPPPARVVPAVPATRPALRMPEQKLLPELSRQQRELQLATSGPRKAAAAKEASPPEYFENLRWGYAGPGAPENWAKLHPSYAACGIGKRQSPIDIRGGIKVDLDPIRFDYRPTQFRITDNGQTIQVDVAEGNTIKLTGQRYQLQHLLFHRPAEVRVNGRAYDMSVHLVHKDFDHNRLIIAVLLEQGSEHPLIQTLWNHLPLEVGMDVAPPDVAIDLMKLLPAGRDYYTHMGSLTIPPCTENVVWVVYKEPLQVSREQIGIFARLYPNNARPVQPLNDRLIKESR